MNIEEEREPKSPLTAGLFRDEMVSDWVRRKSMDIGNSQLSGTETQIRDTDQRNITEKQETRKRSALF